MCRGIYVSCDDVSLLKFYVQVFLEKVQVIVLFMIVIYFCRHYHGPHHVHHHHGSKCLHAPSVLH